MSTLPTCLRTLVEPKLLFSHNTHQLFKYWGEGSSELYFYYFLFYYTSTNLNSTHLFVSWKKIRMEVLGECYVPFANRDAITLSNALVFEVKKIPVRVCKKYHTKQLNEQPQFSRFTWAPSSYSSNYAQKQSLHIQVPTLWTIREPARKPSPASLNHVNHISFKLKQKNASRF